MRRTNHRLRRLGALLLPWLLFQPLGAAAGAQPEPVGESAEVFVSILPQRYFVNAIAGDRVGVRVMIEPGQEPHTFEPTPRQMAELAQARLYLSIGVAFEKSLLPRIRSNNPHLRIVDIRQGIELRQMASGEEEHSAREAEAQRHDHEQQGLDPHVWMSPRLAERLALNTRNALIELDPAGSQRYEQGYRELAGELEALHREIAAALAPYRGREIFVYHPAYGYFAEEYGLEQVAVETGGSEPSARQLARLIEMARRRGVKVIFVQPQFSQSGARAVAEAIGGAVVSLDPLAEDYLDNMRRVAAEVAEALRAGSDEGGG